MNRERQKGGIHLGWAGFFLGIVFGGSFFGLGGAIVMGLLGSSLGIIVTWSQRVVAPDDRPAAPLAPRDEPAQARIERLEGVVARLQERVVNLEDSLARSVEPWVPAATFEEAPAPAIETAMPETAPMAAAKEVAPEPIPTPEPITAAAPPPEPPRSPPREPDAREAPQRGLIDRLLEGNIVAKAGVVILFFGFAFLLKFAYERGLFPAEMRLLAVAAASVAMFFVGRWLLVTRRTFAVILMGGAMGLAYLDVFFALKTFRLIGPATGFVLFALMGVATLFLAVRLEARAFAVLGLLGGFLAPVLASTGGGHHVLLFSYYLLLNLVILATSWFRSWRELNFIGFLFTFAIGLFWGHANYRPELFATVEPFLVAFFFLYLAIPILFAHRQPPQLRGVVDATLVFGMPLTAAMMQAALTQGMGDRILAWSAFLATILYATLARLLWKRQNMRLLAESHVALAIVFGTVAPYFAFEGYPSFAFWTVEGAAIFWIGCRQQRGLARAFALALQLGAAPYFWWVTRDSMPAHAVWNDRVIGCVLIAAASVATAWLVHRFKTGVTSIERTLEGWIIAWAGAWLLVGANLAIRLAWGAPLDRLTALLVVIAAALAAAEYAGRWLSWRNLRMASIAHVPLMAAIAVLWFGLGAAHHPLLAGGAIAWPLAFAVHFHLVHRQLRDGLQPWHALNYRGAWILMALLATWEAGWRWTHADFGWVFAIGVTGLVAAGLRFRLREHAVEKGVRISGWIVAWSLAWWFAGLHGLVEERIEPIHRLAVDLAMVTLSVLLFELAGRALTWRALRRSQLLLPLAFVLAAAHLARAAGHPFAEFQAWAWLAGFAVAWLALFRQERDGIALVRAVQHVSLFAAILLLLAWEAQWRLDRASLSSAWQFAATGAVLALGLAVTIEGLKRKVWPFHAHAEAFTKASLFPLLAFTLIWTLAANMGSDGAAAPWPYMPVVNPLDLVQLALFTAAVVALRPGGPAANVPNARLFLAAAVFLWVNAAVLRTVHHWADVPFTLEALLRSVVAQAALSLLWTAISLVMMFTAGRRRLRSLWMAGAALLALVIAKLFLNDLGNTGTVARIVSFIGVGVFMLVIGYLSPVPPRRNE